MGSGTVLNRLLAGLLALLGINRYLLRFDFGHLRKGNLQHPILVCDLCYITLVTTGLPIKS